MLKPIAFTEHVLFQTIRLELSDGTGTGFLFGFRSAENQYVPVIVTNRHVVNNKTTETVKFTMHQQDDDGHVMDQIVQFELELSWIMHPDKDIDLCCTLFEPIRRFAKNQGITLFFSTCTDELVYTDDELVDMQTVNDVLMIGYPDGLYDKKHCLPIIRKGITATHPAVDFEGKSIGIIDMGCYYGSSGSPLFIYPGISQFSKKRGMLIGVTESKLLGIFFAFICADDDGEIIAKAPEKSRITLHKASADSNTVLSDLSLNMGYYIKAKELTSLRNEVFRQHGITLQS